MEARQKWLLVLLSALLAAGCGSGQTTSTPRSNTPADTSRSPDTTLVEDPSGSDAPADTVAPSAASSRWTAGVTDWRPEEAPRSATLQAVRTGRHPGFDRTVFAFAGDTLPGYHVEHVDEPVRQCGSGRTVPLAGEGFLEVRFHSAQAHTEAGRPTVTERERAPGLTLLKELKLTCDFEGEVAWVLGLASPNRYRVLRLDDPARVVVDVRH